MGNCLNSSSSSAQNALSSNQASGASKFGSKSNLSSILSSQTFSNPSTFTMPSTNDSRNLDILPTARTEGEILSSCNVKAFTYSELKSATRNFRPDSILGEGGFGNVYKGWIDEYTLAPSKPGSGIIVAIKKFKPESFQGHEEWLTKVEYLGQLSHPNLVKLIGYCLDGDNRLLVYGYMPNGNLENHLFRRSSQPLSWAVRMKVAVGAAKGLTFLHDGESEVICRDVKASNILLDWDFNPKLSYFELAIAGPTGDNTHVSTEVRGTYGYIAPEYMATDQLSAKADVYSFGVVLLEILSGRRALDRNKTLTEQNLVDWAIPILRDRRKLYKIMDPRLVASQCSKKSVHIVAKLALDCINNNPRFRPKMSQVLATLEPEINFEASAQCDSVKVAHPLSQKSPMRHVVSPKQQRVQR